MPRRLTVITALAVAGAIGVSAGAQAATRTINACMITTNAKCPGAKLQGQDLRGANLSRANLRGVNLGKADLRGANLSRADLTGANLSKADLQGANLNRADLRGAKLTSATLRRAKMRHARLSPLLTSKRAKRAGSRAFQSSPSCLPNCQQADLEGANLSGANLVGANLVQANLKNANLTYANAQSARFDSAYAHGADLSYANLSYASLMYIQQPLKAINANMTGANLSFADFSVTALNGYIHTNALFNLTICNPQGTTDPVIAAATYAYQSQAGSLPVLVWNQTTLSYCGGPLPSGSVLVSTTPS